MRDTFRPEFLNRIDEIIIFSPLSLEEVEQIVDLQMRGLVERMSEGGISVHLTEPARRWLAEKGYDPQFGARPLRRALQRFVENPLSIQLLKGAFHPGDLVVIDEMGGELIFERHADASTDYLQINQDSLLDQDIELSIYYDLSGYGMWGRAPMQCGLALRSGFIGSDQSRPT